MFVSPFQRSKSAHSSSVQTELDFPKPDQRISISPLRLTDHRETHGEIFEVSLASRNKSVAGGALGVVTKEDISAQSITSRLVLLRSIIFPHFDTTSQSYEHESSVLSNVLDADQCEWLCFEYEELLESYLERSLATIRKRRSARIYGAFSARSDLHVDEPNNGFEYSGVTPRQSKLIEPTVAPKRRSNFYKTPTGSVSFRIKETPDDSMNDERISANLTVFISFMPPATERATGLLGLRIHFSGEISGPAISRQITTFNVILDDSKIIECVLKKDLRGVQTLFDVGAASARDVDSEGRSLLHVGRCTVARIDDLCSLDSQYAMYTGCSDIFRLLLRSGSCTYQCKSFEKDSDVITAIWTEFVWTNCSGCDDELTLSGKVPTEEIRKFEACAAMSQLALDNDCAIDSTDDQNIHANRLFSLIGDTMDEAHPSAILDAINYLSSNCWALEEQNVDGQTALLYAAEECQPHAAGSLRTLIKRGARLDAKDWTGRGPLHSALSPPSGLSNWVDPTWTLGLGAGENNRTAISSRWSTEDQRHAGDYYDIESKPKSHTVSGSADPYRSLSSHNDVRSPLLVFEDQSRVPAEQPVPLDPYSRAEFCDPEIDASSCAKACNFGKDDHHYIYCADEDGNYSWIHDPIPILKNRVGTKLRILLEAGCDPNDLDDEGLSPSEYAREGLWSQWLWALQTSGYVFDEARDRWIKQFTQS